MIAAHHLARQVVAIQRLAEDRASDRQAPTVEQVAAAHVVRQAKGLKKALERWARVVSDAPQSS